MTTTRKTTTATRKPAARKAAVPATARTPQDHQPAAADAPEPTLTATIRGETFTIPAAVTDDFEVMDDIQAFATSGRVVILPGLLRRLIPDDATRARFLNLARDPKTGRVTTEAGADLVGELFEALNPNS